jgi:hypothetical protein
MANHRIARIAKIINHLVLDAPWLQATWNENLRHLRKTKMMRRSLASTIQGLEGALRSTCTKNPIGRNRVPARIKRTANEVALLHLHAASAFCESAQRLPSPKLYHTLGK